MSDQQPTIDDLAMLVRRMVIRLRIIDDHKGNLLADLAIDYLRRTGLSSGESLLRSEPSQPKEGM